MRELVDADRDVPGRSTRSARSAPSRTRPTRTPWRSASAPTGAGWRGVAHRVGAQGPQVREGQGASCSSTMETIAAQPNGFVAGQRRCTTWTPGEFAGRRAAGGRRVAPLAPSSGSVEMCAELIDLVDMPEFNEAWLRVLPLYNATKAEQAARVRRELRQPATCARPTRGSTAYAAVQTGTRRWPPARGRSSTPATATARVRALEAEKRERPGQLVPGSEATWVSTNDHRAVRPRRHREPGAARRQDREPLMLGRFTVRPADDGQSCSACGTACAPGRASPSREEGAT